MEHVKQTIIDLDLIGTSTGHCEEDYLCSVSLPKDSLEFPERIGRTVANGSVELDLTAEELI